MGEALIKTQIDELLTGSCGRLASGGKGCCVRKSDGESEREKQRVSGGPEKWQWAHFLDTPNLRTCSFTSPPSWRHINHGGSAVTYMCAHFPSTESNNGNAWMCIRIQYCYLQRASMLPVFVFSAVWFMCMQSSEWHKKKSSGKSVPQKEAASKRRKQTKNTKKFSFCY